MLGSDITAQHTGSISILLPNFTVPSSVSVLLSTLPRCDNPTSPSGNGWILLKTFLVSIYIYPIFETWGGTSIYKWIVGLFSVNNRESYEEDIVKGFKKIL